MNRSILTLIMKLRNWFPKNMPPLTIGKMREKYSNDPQMLNLVDHIRHGLERGMYIVVFFFLFFIVWGGFAPLDSAVIAHGTIVPTGNTKIVQHFQGGIVEKILIKEGDIVKRGQPLMQLSKTQAKSRLQVLINQTNAKKISEARINSELEEQDSFMLPAGVEIAENPELVKIWETEKKVLSENLNTLKGQIGIHEQQINIANDQVHNLENQLAATNKEKELVQEELNNVRTLYEKQLVQKTRLLSLEKNIAELDIRISEYHSNINKTKESINEVRLKVEQMKQNRKRELSQELKELDQQLASLKQEVDAAQDIENRTVITAPEDGIVTNLRFHTEGGVIPPSQPIMEVTPSNAELIVEAKVFTKDIDVVKEGQPTKIMVTAFKARFTPRFDGKIKYISSDKVVDEKSGQPYYLARVTIDMDSVKAQKKTLLAGMPAEVFIVTGERTFLEYFLSPIVYSLRHSFKEE
ncbi:MAG: HlyD family type I secretion periplasmic adaptor subunit [Alphaproteobacteria bacterium]|nr:HlyD family type I secretion periplasmic adaptor subunit [Alphaproteobacteria bacterium]OJV15308.1 MAG: hypothetical protein BGO27_02235 [Alphaproteobacteria bacterium 33-17]